FIGIAFHKAVYPQRTICCKMSNTPQIHHWLDGINYRREPSVNNTAIRMLDLSSSPRNTIDGMQNDKACAVCQEVTQSFSLTGKSQLSAACPFDLDFKCKTLSAVLGNSLIMNCEMLIILLNCRVADRRIIGPP